YYVECERRFPEAPAMRLHRVRLTVRRLMASVAITVLSLAWLAFPYRPSRYRGDGTITDRGLWSFPRYRVKIPPMELPAERGRRYRLQGTPPVPLTLKLEVVGPRALDENDFETLASMGTRVAVTIADDLGKEVASASGPLRDWVLT